MSLPSDRTAGNIYDLGYRRYEGARLGRRHAVLSLYLFSLRSAFGLGRRATSKIIPVGLACITVLPALIQLGIASVARDTVNVISYEDYYSVMQVVLGLFVATVAPEMVGRDQRNRTLTLYFSRPLGRGDYILAKLVALTTAMLVLTFIPQMVLFAGHAFSGTDTAAYFKDHWTLIPKIAASALFFSLFVSAIALAVAAQTPRRAFATGGIIAVFVVSNIIVAIVVGVSGSGAGRFAVLLSPFDILEGVTYWIFRSTPDPDSIIGQADLRLVTYAVVGVGYIAAIWGLLYRRYRGLSA